MVDQSLSRSQITPLFPLTVERREVIMLTALSERLSSQLTMTVVHQERKASACRIERFAFAALIWTIFLVGYTLVRRSSGKKGGTFARLGKRSSNSTMKRMQL